MDTAALRIIDAANNRAAEGLRCLEDYFRFVTNDPVHTSVAKELRHEIRLALQDLPSPSIQISRDTPRDVGKNFATAAEYARQSAVDVAQANFSRVQQALRSLEEYGKIYSVSVAERMEQLRYRLYTLQSVFGAQSIAKKRLENALLYLLVEASTPEDVFASSISQLIDAGVDVFQLRDKKRSDRTLLRYAQILVEKTQDTSALAIINDRPDIALLARADGVHVGQDELSPTDVRSLVGGEMLIGVSAHSLPQAEQAVLAGASYLGVGPTFPSQTKEFDTFPGVDLLRQVSSRVAIPWFAIGGITGENLGAVTSNGANRIAVQGAILAAGSPPDAARTLKQQLPALSNCPNSFSEEIAAP